VKTAVLVILSVLIATAARAQHVRIALVGDSTVAEGGGWGPGFRASFSSDVEVLNFARNGRSSKSFRDEGLWESALASKPDYILIQFGHNDVPGKGPERETIPATTFRGNLIRYVEEARAQGAQPLVVTSIVRRNLTPEGMVKADSLDPYVGEVRKLASERHILLMELNTLTRQRCQELGSAGCAAWNAGTAEEPDTTHLNAHGQQAVGQIAAAEFVRVVLPGQKFPDLKSIAANTLLPSNRQRTTFEMPLPREPNLPSVFLLGDSTVRNGRGVGANGLWGWGEPFAELFDPSKINAVNRAVSGLSSRTYLTQGHLERVLPLIKPGDLVLLQFGHNDESPINDPTRARGSLPGLGDQQEDIFNWMNGEPETVYTYGHYLREIIRQVRERGAIAIICSPVPRNRWKGDKIVLSPHREWARTVAETEGVAYVDLSGIIAARYEAMGPHATAALFPSDNTHTNREGAEINARSVLQGLSSLSSAVFTPLKSSLQ